MKRLDAKAKRPAAIFGYTLGSVMALVLGIGLCLSMNVLGDGSTLSFALGIIIGVVGLAGVAVNYPIYQRILESSKRKYAADIQALANEIIDGSDEK